MNADDRDYQGCRLLLIALHRPDLYKQYRALGKQGIQQREEDRGKQEVKRKART